MNYERKRKEKTPVIAICYDFDKTLSPDDMQAQGYIQSVGWDVDEFWKKSNELASSSGMERTSSSSLSCPQPRLYVCHAPRGGGKAALYP